MSWNSKGYFHADERTLSQIYASHHDKMYAIRRGTGPYQRLDNQRSTSPRPRSPRGLKSIWSKQGRKKFDEYSEVRECYRRTLESRSQKHADDPHWGVDSKEPVSRAVRAQLETGRATKRQQHQMREHLNNIKHMKRRIADQNKARERQKTAYHTSGKHAPLLRRRPASARSVSPRRLSRPPSATTSMGNTIPTSSRAASPRQQQQQQAPQSPRRRRPERIRYTAPPQAYREFRDSLVDTIVSARMYRASDLHALFRRKVLVNESMPMHSRLDPQRVNNILSDLIYELELDPRALSSEIPSRYDGTGDNSDSDPDAGHIARELGEETKTGNSRSSSSSNSNSNSNSSNSSDDDKSGDGHRGKSSRASSRSQSRAGKDGKKNDDNIDDKNSSLKHVSYA